MYVCEKENHAKIILAKRDYCFGKNDELLVYCKGTVLVVRKS